MEQVRRRFWRRFQSLHRLVFFSILVTGICYISEIVGWLEDIQMTETYLLDGFVELPANHSKEDDVASLEDLVDEKLPNGFFGTAKGSFESLVSFIESSPRICWMILFLSIAMETSATTISKYAQQTASPLLLFISCALAMLSQCGLTASLAQIDVSIAYSVWSALGSAVVAIVGILLFAEQFDVFKVCCLSMIVLGVVGLNLRGGGAH